MRTAIERILLVLAARVARLLDGYTYINVYWG